MKKCPVCSTVYDDAIMECNRCYCDLVVDDSPAQEPIPALAPECNNYNPNNTYTAPQGKYCQHCGNLCDVNAAICVKCGCKFAPTIAPDDTPSTGLKILSFFIPIVALVLYFTNHETKPQSAKAYGKWGIIGFIVNYGIITVFWFLITFFSSFYYYF